MENQYDVGIANRYALFLEEGENSLTAIKKKLSKELRQKNKAIKKENAEAKKSEVTKTPEKPQKPEPKPVNDTSPVKKEVKEVKPEQPKNKEKKPNDGNLNKKEKETSEKPKYNKNADVPVVENENVEKDSSKPNDNPPRKNFENRKPRERKNDDPNQSKTYNNHYRKNKDDWGDSAGTGDSTTDRYQNDENRNIKENGFASYNSDYRPRGGGRGRGGNRGGRGSYNGGDRRRDYDQRNESKPENDAFKSDSWGDEKPENLIENTDNQKDDEVKAIENDESAVNEQKEVKEYLTLDEWKKLQGQRQKPQYNLRKAGEGEDLTQWKNMRELQKKKDEGFLENGRPHEKNNDHEKENTGNENVQRVMRQKHIDINVHFRESSIRGRGGRIIRSNRFGYKNKNDERNDNYGGETRPFRKNREGFNPAGRGGARQNAPKINDEHAFPSLG